MQRIKANKQAQNQNHNLNEFDGKSRNNIWKSQVHSKEDAVAFFKQYYPCFPESLCLALADYIDRGVKGDIPLPSDFVVKPGKHSTGDNGAVSRWDPLEDLEQAKTEGLIKLTEKRLDALEVESEMGAKTKTKKAAKNANEPK